ncbi:MAG: hypothetical protein AAF497_09415 [Planctomycetota bacterium]
MNFEPNLTKKRLLAGLFVAMSLTLVTNSFGQIVQPEDYDHDLAVASPTSLYFFSEQGDFIGQGREYYDESFVSLTVSSTLVDFRTQDWTVLFESIEGEVLEPGFYSGATRYPFNDPTEPGLSIFGQGRGCNQLGGQFEIFEFSMNGPTLDSLDIEFAQYCENESGMGTPALFGRIRWNATVPEPAGLPTLLVLFVCVLPWLRRR